MIYLYGRVEDIESKYYADGEDAYAMKLQFKPASKKSAGKKKAIEAAKPEGAATTDASNKVEEKGAEKKEVHAAPTECMRNTVCARQKLSIPLINRHRTQCRVLPS